MRYRLPRCGVGSSGVIPEDLALIAATHHATMDPQLFAILANRKLLSEECAAQLPQQAHKLGNEEGQVAARSVENPEGKCKRVNVVAAAAASAAEAEAELEHAKAQFAAGVQTMAQNEIMSATTRTEAVEAPAQTTRQGEAEAAEQEQEEDAVCSNSTHASLTRSPPTQSPASAIDATKTPAEAPAADVLARSSSDEILDTWMQVVASFLGVPALGRLACTASRFRTILPSCVSTLAAQASNQVIHCATNPCYQERLTVRYDRLTAVERQKDVCAARMNIYI